MSDAPKVNVQSYSGGDGFVGALTIVFIVLKLTGYIDWTWIWVLSPIWISASIVGAFLLLLLMVALLIAFLDNRK